jgi:hypothetical protein
MKDVDAANNRTPSAAWYESLTVEHAEMGPTVYGLHPQTDSPRLIEGSLQTENG